MGEGQKEREKRVVKMNRTTTIVRIRSRKTEYEYPTIGPLFTQTPSL